MGNLSVSAQLSSAWRDGSANWDDTGSQKKRECQKAEDIQFSNSVSSEISTNFHYNNYSQGFEKADCDDVRHLLYPNTKRIYFSYGWFWNWHRSAILYF